MVHILHPSYIMMKFIIFYERQLIVFFLINNLIIKINLNNTKQTDKFNRLKQTDLISKEIFPAMCVNNFIKASDTLVFTLLIKSLWTMTFFFLILQLKNGSGNFKTNS